jgi:cysteinyl-tRNA synthetase
MTVKPVKLFNTLTRTVETVSPIEPGKISLYCCGPTVYNYQHIGNLRTYIFEDLLVRTLRRAGYKVQHVMNITDVGHLVSDADVGEDKMLVAAKREGRKSQEIAKFYTDIFFNHCALLNIVRPDVVCNATDHIPQMIEMIKMLEEKDIAYKAGGNVYFDVNKFAEYGKLAQLDLDSLMSGARIEVDSNKRSPLDFALWFTKSKFENQELQWDSPWGTGYPGWHIECSAMSRKYLGDEFDIHCGGIDHIPVHHTNEIAQSQGATGKCPARVWMHGNFLVANTSDGENQKMSKSTGEFLTLDLLQEKQHDPMDYRLFCLGTSYRSELSWSWQALDAASRSFAKIREQILLLKQSDTEDAQPSSEYVNEFEEAIFNDLAMPKALAVFHRLLKDGSLSAAVRLRTIAEFDQIFGLDLLSVKETEIPKEITELAQKRLEAKKAKNYSLADTLRKEITERGYAVEDSVDGFKVKPIGKTLT